MRESYYIYKGGESEVEKKYESYHLFPLRYEALNYHAQKRTNQGAATLHGPNETAIDYSASSLASILTALNAIAMIASSSFSCKYALVSVSRLY